MLFSVLGIAVVTSDSVAGLFDVFLSVSTPKLTASSILSSFSARASSGDGGGGSFLLASAQSTVCASLSLPPFEFIKAN